jgi:putative hydrolases of HD superfamily
MSVESIVDTMISVHPLDRVPRAGFLLRGVTEPESVAAHSHSLALLTLLVCSEYPDEFDSKVAVEMALLHDLQEVVTMDIPLPAGTKEFKSAKEDAEQTIFNNLFARVSPSLTERYAEFRATEIPEAKLVRGLDKAQMMIKVLCYDTEGRGNLDEFWNHSHNFPDYGLQALQTLFEAIARRAGRGLPKK